MHGDLSLGSFGDENYHIMIRSVACDYIHAHRSRSKQVPNWKILWLIWGKWGSQVMGSKYQISGFQLTLQI